MITANEARKIIIEEEKKKVEAKITKAIENGNSSCCLGFFINFSKFIIKVFIYFFFIILN